MSKILCTDTKKVFDALGYFQGFKPVDFLGPVLEKFDPIYMERDNIENDYNIKQLIPYVLIKDKNQGVFVYRRTPMGEEGRLHGKLSLGIGGHVNDDETLFQGARREVMEEVGLLDFDLFFHGFVNNDNTDVGRVHLGIVFIVKTELEKDIEMVDAGVEPFGFLDPEECASRSMEFEGWSELIIPYLL